MAQVYHAKRVAELIAINEGYPPDLTFGPDNRWYTAVKTAFKVDKETEVLIPQLSGRVIWRDQEGNWRSEAVQLNM